MECVKVPRGPLVMARNLDSGEVIAAPVGVTVTRAERARGLLGRADLESDEGLWIAPSRGVHTCGMRFPRRYVVGVLELPEGSLRRTKTRLGHRLAFEVTTVLPGDARGGDQ
jgi:uncharacterized membrane protein (UPF0127 family)